ncbi:hypothetical protein N7491_009342 [Penicillium cf. griseofulvum]|uniref:SRR1-like domain-containing protein n=1 Tax=Penicillium cf. griseofulvum TaxID=2972120 RepID=A0A9W9JTW8_9EURO|nr:hypothetical protein N7472_005065 [Penicillium cf. griseofulvum]KAJ5424126.1 hypothetical protein N7491_009342 [Penicillium cf. griseofulvum]KAJ5442634.1 hypothetical protein N7445_005641 [Penicillium cf. griseofulvum]
MDDPLKKYLYWKYKSGEEQTMKKDKAVALIKEMDDLRKPFFTKKSLRQLGEQLQKWKEGNKIEVKSLTGAIVEGQVKLGFVLFDAAITDSELKECTNSRLFIEYAHPERLIKDITDIDQNNPGINIPAIYLTPLRVTYEPFKRVWNPKQPVVSFNHAREAWERSETYRKFKLVLSSNASGHKIERIVGFACGSLSQPNRPGAAYQHALLVTAKEWVANQDEQSSFYLQDPDYTTADEEILKRVGFEVVPEPNGFLKVDERSIVLSIAPTVPIKHIIAAIARPAIVIWLPMGEGKDAAEDPNTNDVMKMATDYEEHPFIDENDPLGKENFRGAVIYIKKVVTVRPE